MATKNGRLDRRALHADGPGVAVIERMQRTGTTAFENDRAMPLVAIEAAHTAARLNPAWRTVFLADVGQEVPTALLSSLL